MSPLPRKSLLIASLLTWLPVCIHAHMQLSWPYPLRSPLDPDVPYYEKDYSMTSPLLPDGSDYSCKHYTKDYADTNVTKATYVAGGTYDMWLNGTATHDGGSCQLSLSYDNGATFKVIKSIIGGCPIVRTYDFTIPEYAPASDTALLSWSWFNLEGNREFYQNCARVKIVSNQAQRYRRTPFKRQTSMNDLPDIFTCNIGNGCQTIEGEDVIFPNPGNDVVYGQDAITPHSGIGYTISGAPATSTASTTPATAGLSDSPTTAAATSTSSGFPSALVTTTTGTPLETTTSQPPFPIANTTITTGLPSGTGLPDPSGPILTLTGSITYFTPTSTSSLSTATMTGTSTEPSLLTESSTPSSTESSTSSLLSSIFMPSFLSSILSPTETTSIPTTFITLTTSPPSSEPSTSSPMSISTPTSTSTTTSAPSAPSASATSSCVPGTFECNSLTTFSQCVSTSSSSTTYVYMGSVAAGMQCVNGQFVRESSGTCTPSGSIFCNGENAFYLCDQGGLVDMGPVAPGTACRNGVIGFA
ncbi:hypothetical protein A1O1_02767 [Capronia coronata CBS 617.96]|uniref:DNA-directed RNA polymerase n=1 Tax=Capronia coronata CBS 617.96 TaxID=1182541 RepID=W9YPC3_9EURO|nr:uncharacterized protein A1O1_02767 [Capronia coronata CBS 617.96]EXJ94373.1 hypothetical protein A1O1_02767 [Capronia coronata CBS 617.96]